MEYYEIFSRYFLEDLKKSPNSESLFVVLGTLADFDSFEYAQLLSKKLDQLQNSSLKLRIIGIGNEISREKFCRFNKIPLKNLIILSDNKLHEELKLYSGLSLPLSPILNLFLMCMGFNSPGTLNEVLRGYLGDKQSQFIFKPSDKITLGDFLSLKGSMFDIFYSDRSLRPFELATRRLSNMIEILSGWDDYTYNKNYLCQRGGTFLFDNKGKLIYSYKSKALLSFAENMNNPLFYLDPFFLE